MNILLADTSSSVCITGVANEEKILIENSINNGKTHSENFMPLIKKTVEDSKMNLSDVDLISVVVGPGSFTGIRIGIASVKAMAEVSNKKIIAINSLESLAGNEDGKEVICSMIDARNNQVYMGLFDCNLNKIEELMADDINVCLEKISKYNNICFIGNGSLLHKEIIEEKFKNKNIEFSSKNSQSLHGLWKATINKTNTNDFLNADELAPLYLRKSQAERLKK